MKGEVKAGELRKRIDIESVDVTPTASGATTDTVVFFAQVWASVEPLSGREAWIAKEQQSTITHKIRIRYLPGINSRMRATYNGRVFNFTSVVNVGEWNHTLEILATEVV